MTPHPAIATFEKDILGPALDEIASSRNLARDFVARVLGRPLPSDAPTSAQRLHAALRGDRRIGPTLILSATPRAPDWPPEGGIYVMSPFYDVRGDTVFASPGVAFWMRFNGNTHVFAHRYDNAIAEHPIDRVTRPQVLNHVLNSVGFFKMFMDRPTPFPGYR